MTSGRHSDYYWIQWESAFLDALLQQAPEIVTDHYLVNTSFDSGTLSLSADERQHGWHAIGERTYSPLITEVEWIPHDCFDEWLVFLQPTEVFEWQSLVNYSGFSMTDPQSEALKDKLWSQIESAIQNRT